MMLSKVFWTPILGTISPVCLKPENSQPLVGMAPQQVSAWSPPWTWQGVETWIRPEGVKGGAGETNGDGDGGDDLGPEDKGRGGSGRGGRPRQFTPSGASPNAEARAGGGGRPASIRKRVNSTNTQAGAPSTDSDSSSQRSLGRSSRPTRKRIIYLGGDYLSPQAQKEKERSVVRSLKPPPEGRGIQNLRQPQFDLDVPKRQLASSKNEGVSLGFGALIKFLLIGALLIALLVFLGGQAMQIKKGWQKGE